MFNTFAACSSLFCCWSAFHIFLNFMTEKNAIFLCGGGRRWRRGKNRGQCKGERPPRRDRENQGAIEAPQCTQMRYGPGPRISMQASGKHRSAASTGRTHESAVRVQTHVGLGAPSDHPVRRRLTKGRGSPNLFVMANKKETRDASNQSWPPLCKGGLGGDKGGGRGRRRGRPRSPTPANPRKSPSASLARAPEATRSRPKSPRAPIPKARSSDEAASGTRRRTPSPPNGQPSGQSPGISGNPG